MKIKISKPLRHSKNKTSQRSSRRLSLCLLSCVAVAAASVALPSIALAQTRLGVGSIPYIVIVTDTSASTEYTDRGSDTFPQNSAGVAYQAGDSTNVVDTTTGALTVGPPSDPKNYAGACAIWEPPTCSDYERPSRYTGPSGNGSYGPEISATSPTWANMYQRIQHDLANRRLKDDDQPKHITIKEILTGDMIYGSTDQYADADLYGPTCWLIPRQYNSLVYPEMSQYCPTGPFRQYNDAQEPVPHLQEVFDFQKKNGLLDTLSRSAIFAFSGLDSYKEPGLYDDPYKTYPAAYYPSGRGQKNEGEVCNNGHPCFNLGVTGIIGPKVLDSLSFSELNTANEYTQLAIVDMGYMAKPGDKPKINVTGTSGTRDPRFQASDARFLADLPVGQQPIARATPLAAAVYDVGNFFALSQTDTKNPLHQDNDPYTQCRDRQVILISDGAPAPERESVNINAKIGAGQLDAAFGYDPDLFPYDTTEKEISFLHQYKPALGKNVKVHVVALLDPIPAGATGAQLENHQESLRKVDAMAASGGTCASESLSDQWISTTPNPRECPRNGGPGVDNGVACLDTTPRGDYGNGGVPSYMYEDPATGMMKQCKFPALVLTKNSRADIEAALAETMNNIIQESNVLSKTRTVYSSFLGQVDTCASTKVMAKGENEFLSGTMIGGGISWKGLLYRNQFACGCNPALACSATSQPPKVTDLSEQISKQVKKDGANYKDNRRIFTTFPSRKDYDYDNTPWFGTATPIGYKAISTSQPDLFFRPVEPYQVSGGFSWSTFTTGPRLSPNNYPGIAGKTQIEFELDAFAQSGLFPDYSSGGKTYSSVPVFLGVQHYIPEHASNARAKEFFDRVRGRHISKDGRVLAGISYGNPVVLDPPSLDIPIDSYKIFKVKNRQRPSILFVPTVDGMLHAIYGGEGQRLDNSNQIGVIKHRAYRTGTEALGAPSGAKSVIDGSSSQRESWAFIPFMLLRKLRLNYMSNPYLMDATPTVKDVRLCHPTSAFNTNKTSCGTSNVLPEEQWRSVLVQGMGMAGKGYYALDVTYQGGATNLSDIKQTGLPDPTLLWEFSDEIEVRQTEFLKSKNKESRIGSSINPCSSAPNADEFWTRSLMGYSVSNPEIGTVLIDKPTGVGRIQRPIALFGGGEPDPNSPIFCASGTVSRSGRAVYVTDLQSGSIIRRFVSYYDENNNEKLFENGMIGSPALYNAFPGAVATRGFIGDSKGRLFKIDMTSSDPDQWKVYLFFDPAAPSSLNWFAPSLISSSKKVIMGEAAYKPAITKMHDNNLLVVYGLGELGDTVSLSKVRAVFGLRDRINADPTADLPVKKTADPTTNDAIWFKLLDDNQKLTGTPVIFNNMTYYPTYKAQDPKNLCLPGDPQITQVDINGTEQVTTFDPTAQSTIIRGLSVRINPCCAGNQTPPELVASTGGTDLVQNTLGGSSSSSPGVPVGKSQSSGDLKTFRQSIATPTSQSIPLSWARLIN